MTENRPDQRVGISLKLIVPQSAFTESAVKVFDRTWGDWVHGQWNPQRCAALNVLFGAIDGFLQYSTSWPDNSVSYAFVDLGTEPHPLLVACYTFDSYCATPAPCPDPARCPTILTRTSYATTSMTRTRYQRITTASAKRLGLARPRNRWDYSLMDDFAHLVEDRFGPRCQIHGNSVTFDREVN